MIRIRETPEDFKVDEEPLYPPAGEGDHTFVRVEKRLRTTEEVARALARTAGVKARDVGYAGRKDRVAVATQWLSVPGLAPEAALAFEMPGVRVLEAVPHPHKLRTGQLRGNRFELTVRGLEPVELASAQARLGEFRDRGFANRFGAQRFGRDGDNAIRARRLVSGEEVLRDRRAARFLVSAWQATVFNAVLDARPLPIDRLETGDVAVKHVSGGLFVVEDVGRESPRAAEFEISATGPIFGSKTLQPAGVVAERESAVLAEHGVDLTSLRIPGVRLRGARRALRCRPENARLEGTEDAARLCFTLPSGSYATVLVEALFGSSGEVDRGPASPDTRSDRAVS